MKGTVKFFNVTKGFGFIKADDGKELFVHQSDITPGHVLKENSPVEFEVVMGERGPKAQKVSLVREGEEGTKVNKGPKA